MLLKNKYIKIIILSLLLLPVFNLYSQEKKPSAASTNLTVGKIKFTGIKTTNPKFLLSKISIKEGSVWNEEVKKETLLKLLEVKAIVEDVKIVEDKINNTVDLTIEILEKSPFVFVPYATYSNSRGLIPKLIFRDYNLFGYQKYLNAKLEFIPKESFNFLLTYKDPSVLNDPNLNYQITGEFRFSAINYFANIGTQGEIRGIRPFGVISGTNNTDVTWNSENFVQGILSASLNYTTPLNKIIITPSFGIDYKRTIMQTYSEKETFKTYLDNAIGILKNYDYYKAENEVFIITNPIDKIRPNLGLNLSIPMKRLKGSTIETSISCSYSFILGDDDIRNVKDTDFGRNMYDSMITEYKFGFNFLLPLIEAYLNPYVKFRYTKNDTYKFSNPSLNATYIYSTADYIDGIIGLNFTKVIKKNVFTHTIKLNGEFEDRLLGNTVVTKKYLFGKFLSKQLTDAQINERSFEDSGVISYLHYREYLDDKITYIQETEQNFDRYFRFKFEFNYEMDYNFFKAHHLKNKIFLFSAYNQTGYISGYTPGNLTLSGYTTAASSDLSGFMGMIWNIKYEIPLFYVETPKFISFKVKRPFKWDIYWDIYADIGFFGNDYIVEDQDIIYSLMPARDRYLNVYPVISLGTAVRVAPKFAPLEITLDVSADIYKIYKLRSIGGNTIFIKFGIEDKF